MNRKVRQCTAALAAILAVAALPAEALVIQGTATDQGGFFSYELFVVDNMLPDLTLVNINDAPMNDPLIGPSLMAPVGFLADYDSGLGILTFFDNLGLSFNIPETGPFTFNSQFGPSSFFTMSEGLDSFLNSVPMDPVNITLVQNQVPAPGSLALLGMGLGLLGMHRPGRHNLKPPPRR